MKRLTSIALSLATISAIAATPYTYAPDAPVSERMHINTSITKGQVERPQSFSTNISRADWDFGKPIYELPEGGDTKVYRRSCDMFYYSYDGLTLSADDYFAAEVVYYENGDVYMRNMIPSMVSGSYLKGTLEGNKITLRFPQVLCYEEAYIGDDGSVVDDGFWPVFCGSYDLNMEKGEVDVYVDPDKQSMTFTISEDGSITQDDNDYMIAVFTQGEIWYGESAWNMKYTPFTDKPATMPEGLKTERWALATEYTAFETVMGFDGNDVYWQGLYPELGESVVKGKIDGNKMVFESLVYLGIDPATQHFAYFAGTKTVNNRIQITEDATLPYDAEKGTLTYNRKYLIINSGDSNVNLIAQYYSPKVYRQSETPDYAAPLPPVIEWVEDWQYDPWSSMYAWFTVLQLPNIDTNGNLLDKDRMWYNIYFDDELYWFDTEDYGLVEDSPDVPYTYDDNRDIYYRGGFEHFVYFYWTGWKKMGVQTIFEDNDGNLYKSEITEYINTAIDDTDIDAMPVSEVYYDIHGRKINQPNGLCIKQTIYSDGKVKTQKLINK